MLIVRADAEWWVSRNAFSRSGRQHDQDLAMRPEQMR